MGIWAHKSDHRKGDRSSVGWGFQWLTLERSLTGRGGREVEQRRRSPAAGEGGTDAERGRPVIGSRALLCVEIRREMGKVANRWGKINRAFYITVAGSRQIWQPIFWRLISAPLFRPRVGENGTRARPSRRWRAKNGTRPNASQISWAWPIFW